jgi:uncharacterized protein YciI
MLFVNIAIDKPGAAAVRAATRAAHLDYVRTTGAVRLGGPFLGPDDGMEGSLVILDVADIDAAKAWVENDPYAKAGLFARTELRLWKPTLNACGAAL